MRLENKLNPKIEALFDEYKQHTYILERIERKITSQDEITGYPYKLLYLPN